MNCICLKMRLENECCRGKRPQVWDTNLNINKCHKKYVGVQSWKAMHLPTLEIRYIEKVILHACVICSLQNYICGLQFPRHIIENSWLQPWYQIGSEWCCNRQNILYCLHLCTFFLYFSFGILLIQMNEWSVVYTIHVNNKQYIVWFRIRFKNPLFIE